MDALLLTHYHVDHIFGLTDLVYYSFKTKGIEVYTDNWTQRELRKIFPFLLNQNHPVHPKLRIHDITRKFDVCGIEIMSLPVSHGKKEFSNGFRIGNMAYVSDANIVPRETELRMQGLDLLILGALQPLFNPKHFSLPEAIDFAKKIGAKKTYFTHLGHKIDYHFHSEQLPDNMFLAYDDLVLVI